MTTTQTISKPKAGAKMGQARLKNNLSEWIWASDFDKDKHGEVVCFDNRCLCRVKGVRAYPKTVGDEQIIVPAYFSLWPNVEHAHSCRYNVEKTIKKFVARSKAIRQIDQSALPILEKIGQGQAAEFRLHILMEALEKTTYGIRPRKRSGSPIHRIPQSPTGTEYIRTDKVLTPYFRTAKGILALVARIQSHPDLAAWITLKMGSQRIHWDEFFFDLEQYEALHQYLLAEKHLPPSLANLRPVALVARIFKEAKLLQIGDEYRVIGSSRVINTESGKLAIRPVFYFRDKDLAEQKAQEPFLLVCGLPRLGEVKLPDRPYLNPRVDISIKVVDPRQVCQYSPK